MRFKRRISKEEWREGVMLKRKEVFNNKTRLDSYEAYGPPVVEVDSTIVSRSSHVNNNRTSIARKWSNLECVRVCAMYEKKIISIFERFYINSVEYSLRKKNRFLFQLFSRLSNVETNPSTNIIIIIICVISCTRG